MQTRWGYHRRQNLDDNRRIEKESWAHFEEALHGCVKVEVSAVTVAVVVIAVVIAVVVVAVLIVTVVIWVCPGCFTGHIDPRPASKLFYAQYSPSTVTRKMNDWREAELLASFFPGKIGPHIVFSQVGRRAVPPCSV
jgi:fatty acid desaturase